MNEERGGQRREEREREEKGRERREGKNEEVYVGDASVKKR